MVLGEGLVRLSLPFPVVWPLSRPPSCLVFLRALQIFAGTTTKTKPTQRFSSLLMFQTSLWFLAGPLPNRFCLVVRGGVLTVSVGTQVVEPSYCSGSLLSDAVVRKSTMSYRVVVRATTRTFDMIKSDRVINLY